jgi:hypothetical protein
MEFDRPEGFPVKERVVMRVRGKSTEPDIEEMLGAGGNVELVPILIPIPTYELILNKASEEGCTTADILGKALLQYLCPKPKVISGPESMQPPVMIVKKRH